jgi:hypothetical protein
MIRDTKTQSPNSLDELLSSVRDEKKHALALVGIAKKGVRLSDKEIEKIAHAIYMSTFVKSLSLRYNDSDKNGNTACLRPDIQIIEEVETYGLPEGNPDSRYSITRMANPAFWCAAKNFINTSAYNPVNPKPENKVELIWRKREKRTGIIEAAAEYEMIFHEGKSEKDMPLKTYMVTNLRMVLYGNQD